MNNPKYEKFKLNPEEPAIPCGLVAKAVFNDTFKIVQKVKGKQEKSVSINSTGIAWESDRKYIYKNIKTQ